MFLMKNKVIQLDMRIFHFNLIFKISTQHPHFTNTLMMPTSTTFDFFSTNHDTLNMEEGQTPQFHVDVGQSTNVIGRDDRGHYVNQQGRISRNSSTQD
uniref:Uncharacterized protein n=1 Tax=Cucumis sativus TaxID=3659 RepID=A0A0A0L8B6_CUCSA